MTTTLEESLYSYLSNYSSLTAVVGTNIFLNEILQGPTASSYLPCVVFQRIDTPRILTHDSSGSGADLARPRFQFDAYATTYAVAKSVTTILRSALNGKVGYIGTQVETATVVGTITVSGTALITVTCTGMTNTGLPLSVAVLIGDTNSVVAGKIRTLLNDNADINSFLIVGGSGTNIVLTKLNTAEINGLNIDIANGTCAGLTAAPISVNTSFTSQTISALVNDERYLPEPETNLERIMSDYIVWNID